MVEVVVEAVAGVEAAHVVQVQAAVAAVIQVTQPSYPEVVVTPEALTISVVAAGNHSFSLTHRHSLVDCSEAEHVIKSTDPEHLEVVILTPTPTPR